MADRVLDPDFYQQSTMTVAKALLGCTLTHGRGKERTGGRIVETEAYLFRDDPACHAHRGMTKRNAAMFGPAGRSYIYLIYGMYRCFNVVTSAEGEGEAVLIRALEPTIGIELMQRRRKTTNLLNLCSGPGKLVMALGLDSSHNDSCLRAGPIKILSPEDGWRAPKIVTTTRIGISLGAELPLRYYLADNRFISKPVKSKS